MYGSKGRVLLERFRMESILVALIGEATTLAGLVLSNSRSHTVMKVKIDEPTKRVEKHNCPAERTRHLEKNVAAIRRDVGLIDERIGR